MNPIALVGLPGSGKSTIGRQLAKRLARPFVDTDKVVEARLGCSIREYFEREGEARFRDHESTALEDVVAQASGVIATGGGVVLRQGNRTLLQESTRCVYVFAAPESLAVRLRHDTRRPLMQGVDPLQRIQELFMQRDPLYRESSHVVVDTRRSNLPALLDEIVAALAL